MVAEFGLVERGREDGENSTHCVDYVQWRTMKRWHHCMSNNAMPMVGDEVNRDSTDDCPLASGRRGAKRRSRYLLSSIIHFYHIIY